MSEKYKALRDALAAGPTNGPWFSDAHGNIWRRHPAELYENGGGVAGDKPIANFNIGWHGEDETGYPAQINGAFSAQANPETIRNLLAERDQLLQACETALSYVEAVCFNTPNEKKRRNYADCAAKIRAAMGEDEGEPHD